MTRTATGPPPSWSPRGSGGLRVDLRLALIPVSLGLLAVATLVLEWPLPALLGIAFGLPLLWFAVQTWTARAWRAFERRFNLALATGDHDALVQMVRGAWWLRAFGPRDRMLSRYGLVLTLHGAWRGAEQALEEAWVLSRPAERARLLGPIARVKLELDAWDELRSIAHQWAQRAGRLPGPRMYDAVLGAVSGERTVADARDAVRALAAEGGASDRTLAEALDAKLASMTSPSPPPS